MKETDIILFKEMIKDALRIVVKEELDKFKESVQESVKKANAKDLKEIKALVGKQILEARKGYPSSEERVLKEETKSRLGELFNKMNNLPRSGGPLSGAVNNAMPNSNPIKSVLMETAMSAEFNSGDLGIGQLTDEPQFLADMYSQQAPVDYGEMEEYESSNIPDFNQMMGNRTR